MLLNYPKETVAYAIENRKIIIEEEEYLDKLSQKILELKEKEVFNKK
jgi:hypothetical protein